MILTPTTSLVSVQPVTNTERIQTIDFTRGLALFGILVINIQTYALFFFLLSPDQVYALKLDKPGSYIPLNFVIKFFVEGQFYTMYSFLFGLGFYLLLEKNKRLGLNSTQLVKRRLWVLLVVGLVHGLLFWFGDILHKYALLGFTLLYFNKKTVPVLWKWIAGLMIFVLLFTLVKYTFFVTEKGIAEDTRQMASLVGNFIEIWKHGSFLDVLGYQKFGVLVGHLINVSSGFFYYIHYEIMFLIGLIVGKIDLLNNRSGLKPMLRRLVYITLPVAFLLKGVSCLPLVGITLVKNAVYQELTVTLLQFVGVPLLTISYLILIFLLIPEKQSRTIAWIANTGRLGLTNYLAQTLICMILFYGYAFGLSGRLTLLETMGIALLIYIAQIVYSNLWLRYFRVGPLEWLWRSLTYWKRQPILRIPA